MRVQRKAKEKEKEKEKETKRETRERDEREKERVTRGSAAVKEERERAGPSSSSQSEESVAERCAVVGGPKRKEVEQLKILRAELKYDIQSHLIIIYLLLIQVEQSINQSI